MTDSLAQFRPPFEPVPEVRGNDGMAATSHPKATEVAIAILKAGGSAVDAAIAANAMLGLCEPTGCGLGGDLFAIVWDRGELHGINGSGRSPAGLLPEEFSRRNLEIVPTRGPLSVTVPGCVDGWAELHKRFGALPWAQIFEPVIESARAGILVPPVIASGWVKGAEDLKDFPGFKDVFMPDGDAPIAGSTFKNAALADTLEQIAAQGRDAFYSGDIAKKLVSFLSANGCFIDLKDLSHHQSDWIEPVSTDYRGYTVWELPPNGQGIAVLQMLNLIEPHNVSAMGVGSTDWIHLLVEVKKIVYSDMACWYADTSFASVPVDSLISKSYARARSSLFDPRRAALNVTPGDPRLTNADTVCLSVADRRGQMVSLIQSNYAGLGSGLAVPELGFGLQNRGCGFDLHPGRPNSYAPGKRPFHTIIPAFVTRNGDPYMSFGLMGGPMQPQGHVQILVNLIDFGMGIQEAGDALRICHVGSSDPTGQVMSDGGEVWLEHGHSDAVKQGLKERGHKVGERDGPFGGYQAIGREVSGGGYTGASERRKDGFAAAVT